MRLSRRVDLGDPGSLQTDLRAVAADHKRSPGYPTVGCFSGSISSPV